MENHGHLPPNVWIHNFEKYLKQNRAKFRYEINNEPHTF
jgi:hypothetical protein